MAYEWRACSHPLNAPAWHATPHVLYARTPSAVRRMAAAWCMPHVDTLSAVHGPPGWNACTAWWRNDRCASADRVCANETGASNRSTRAPYRRNTNGGTGGPCTLALHVIPHAMFARIAFPTNGRRTAAPPRALTVMTSMPAVSTYWLMTCIRIARIRSPTQEVSSGGGGILNPETGGRTNAPSPRRWVGPVGRCYSPRFVQAKSAETAASAAQCTPSNFRVRLQRKHDAARMRTVGAIG